MASLIIVRRGGDIVAHCDAVCYDATQPVCVCKACEGRNHGVGYEQAVANTRALVADWNPDAGEVELGGAVQNLALFPLPQET
ncbi:MAG TPA: hypothetical protein VHA75_02430 [Rugosimonospora sp.]|nr:hypothetical protein [Rugosimonospora sp.]